MTQRLLDDVKWVILLVLCLLAAGVTQCTQIAYVDHKLI